MDHHAIEAAAVGVNQKIWAERSVVFGGEQVSPEWTCEPWAAAEVLGLSIYEAESLGRFGSGGDRFEIAGALDRSRRLIGVCSRFGRATQRFTAAHEIGHFVLHQELVMHRDRPVFEVNLNKPLTEKEADYFAACFLAPRKLVQREFRRRFGREPLVLNDTVAYHLRRDSSHELLNAPTDSLLFPMAAATASSFDGLQFRPLSEFFGISRSAMAIRLREFGSYVHITGVQVP